MFLEKLSILNIMVFWLSVCLVKLVVHYDKCVFAVILVVTQWVQHTCRRAWTSHWRQNERETCHRTCHRVSQGRSNSELFDRHPGYGNQQTRYALALMSLFCCLMFICYGLCVICYFNPVCTLRVRRQTEREHRRIRQFLRLLYLQFILDCGCFLTLTHV